VAAFLALAVLLRMEDLELLKRFAAGRFRR
jgi:hypothetical protein